MTRRPWASSTRSKRLPPDWTGRRRQVKTRARGRCEATVHDPRCDGQGSECDHIIPGDDHSIENLMWLSAPCHKAKTIRETKERNARLATMKRRPGEKHPGALD